MTSIVAFGWGLGAVGNGQDAVASAEKSLKKMRTTSFFESSVSEIPYEISAIGSGQPLSVYLQTQVEP